VGFDPRALLEAYGGTPSNYTTTFLGAKYITGIPVASEVFEIPRLQEIIKDPQVYVSENTDYTMETVEQRDGTAQRLIDFRSGTYTLADPPPDTLWAEITYLDNRPTIEANFGRMVNFNLEDMENRSDDLDYLSAVRGLWWAYFGGRALFKVRVGTQIMLGLPFSEAEGTITSIEPNFSATEGRIVIQDRLDENIVRTYFYPLRAGLAVHTDTGVTIAEGDDIAQFAPLSGGIEVLDYIKDPEWLYRYVSQGKHIELDKFFRFLVRGDVDTFSLANLVFAIDFVKKIKPHYTYPLFVLLKNVKAVEVDVLDVVTFDVTLNLFDVFCSNEVRSFRWDDTDEGGGPSPPPGYDGWVHAYDATGPSDPTPFLYDLHRLCPSEALWAIVSHTHAGGAGWSFDTIWSYDDGGGADILALSGPAPTPPPPPYGPLVGTIEFDDTVPAGVYTRIRPM
jgi:hypothetical protein